MVNLLKSKVYSGVNFSQDALDYFEYYVNKYKIRGRKKFATAFEESEFLELEQVETLREEMLGESSALQKFLTGSSEKREPSGLNNFNILSKMAMFLRI